MGKGWIPRSWCCAECGVDYYRARADWVTCLACALPRAQSIAAPSPAADGWASRTRRNRDDEVSRPDVQLELVAAGDGYPQW
jgi:hypothetical protein